MNCADGLVTLKLGDCKGWVYRGVCICLCLSAFASQRVGGGEPRGGEKTFVF